MNQPTRLNDSEIRQRLDALTGWSLQDGKLHREFQFADFVTAFSFMSAVALVAESMAHHPEWFNVYRTVRVDLATHDVDGISELDFALAKKMNDLAEGRPAG
jgi:4a-hydroxytetrahydrobiopterin dehydratase